MKSRRILTMLLSLAIMLTFMPSMAFALEPAENPESGHDFTILSDKSNVEYTVAPTCTTPGIGVVTCTKSHGGVQCKATKNVEVDALGHKRGEEITVTAAEFAAQQVKQGDATETEANTWLEGDGKQICTGKVYVCANCGAYLTTGGPVRKATFDSFYRSAGGNTHEHLAPAGTPACAATFDCVNCGQKGVSNSTYNAENSAAYHGIDPTTGEWTWNNYNRPNSHFEVVDEYEVHRTTSQYGTTESVYVKDLKCKECGLERKLYQLRGALSIRDFEHPNKVTVTVDPTCTTAGYTATVCADCGYELDRQGVRPLGHDYQKKIVSLATETHGDIEAEVCTRCNAVKAGTRKEVTPPLEHSITSTVVAPNSCTDCTWILLQCTNPDCQANPSAIFIKSNAQVDKRGSKYYATFDGKLVEVPFVDYTGHTWGDMKELHAATCTDKAEEGRTCTVCGAINHASVRETSPALGHAVEEVVVPATCGEYGYSYKLCTRCNNYLSQDGKNVLGKDAAALEAAKYSTTQPVVKLGEKCQYEWKTLEEATPFALGTRAKVCKVCNNELAATKESIAKKTIAAPKVKAQKKKAKVTVKAVEGAVKYQILVNGKVSKTVKKAGTFTVKKGIKASKKGKKNTFKIRAINADGVKATSKAKSVKIKK